MKKKILNLIELISQVALLLLLLLNKGVALVNDPDFMWAQDVDLDLGVYTFFDFAIVAENYFPLILMGIMVVNAIICLISFVSKDERRDGIIHTVLAVIICIFSAAYLTSIAAPSGYDAIIGAPLKSGGIICALIVAILSVVKRSKYVVSVEENKQTINNVNVEQSNADELKKYKELLDSGVISQEEFDAMKKQLLGL